LFWEREKEREAIVRRTIVLLVAATAMLTFWAGPAISQTSPGETLDANSLPKITYVAELHTLLDSYYPASAQTFTAINSGALTSAQIQMYKVLYEPCETVGDIRFQIATVDQSGLPTNNILAETTLPASAVVTEDSPGVGDLVTVQFSNPAQVEAGNKYALIYSLESPSGTCPEYWLPVQDDVYPGGATASYSEDFHYPPGWGGFSTDSDHVFAIYVTPIGPASKADCKKGGYSEFGFASQKECMAFVRARA
jgi:hypothetical protein